jgi:AraC-like DNA-binding protein
MPSTSLKNLTTLKFQKLNFDIVKFEDLFKLQNEEVLTKNHKVDFYGLFFITENVGRISIDFTDYYFSKGTILAIRKDQIRKFYKNKEAKGYIFCFSQEFLNGYLNENEVAKTIQMFNEMLISPKTQLTERYFKNLLILVKHVEFEFLKISDDYSFKIIRSLLHVLVTLIHRIKSEGRNNVQLTKYLKEFIRFQNMLEEDYCKTKKVADYANKLGFSTKKLNTIVQLIVNKSAKVFIDDTVVIKIKGLLLHSNHSIKEIAFKVGFIDPTNLYKYFKKFTNFTPEDYRKRYKV